MIVQFTQLFQDRLTYWSPKTSRSLSNSWRKMIAAGRMIPASTWTPRMIVCRGAFGIQHQARGREPGPAQIIEPQALIGHAALLEKELPGSDGRAHDRNDQEGVAGAHPPGGIGGHERVVEELAPRDPQVPAHDQPDNVEQAEADHHALSAPIARGEDEPD